MTSTKLMLGIAGALCLSIGCSGNQPLPIGSKGEPCAAGGGCKPGLLCLSGMCTEPPDSATAPTGGNPGSGTGGSAGAGGPAGTGGQGGFDGATSVGSCIGAPESCAAHATESRCKLVGCYWSSSLPSVCVGTASPCATFGTEYSCALAGCSWQLGPPSDAALGGSPGVGGVVASGGAPGSGGTVGSGGLGMTGGAPAGGGTVAVGGSGPGGAGGSSCSNVAPCGGDVTGTWAVAASCLNVSGNLDMSMLGIGCAAAPVVGSLHVTGTWTAKSDGTYVDGTTTTGTEQLTLAPSCLAISGTTTNCESLNGALTVFGYATVACTAAAGGGCVCSAVVSQTGGLGLVSLDARPSGTYTTWGSMITTDSQLSYSYCASGNQMTWTPQSTSPTTTGTIVFQRQGTPGSGGAIPTGGTRAGGAGGAGGRTGSGGSGGRGGGTGSGGATTSFRGPCDIYAADGGPCVAAHSTVRRLSSAYDGPLYQIRSGGSKSGTGGTTIDVRFLPDGFADGSATDMACLGTTCTISVIYDQSGLGNHLTVAPAGGAKKTPDNETNAKGIPITVGGRNLYGVHVQSGIGYRNNKATGLATGDNAETMYMIASANYYNGGCCFDYGNVETNNSDNGEGAAEAVYFGNCTIWGKGGGDGPWVMADLENGLWAGDMSPYEPNLPVPTSWRFVTGMVKGDAAGKNHWTIKVGNGESGALTTPFDGPRPSSRYNPMRKEGGIVLGTAGDNSNVGQGNFFEGVMTAHYSSNSADDLVQANIVAAYGQ